MIKIPRFSSILFLALILIAGYSVGLSLLYKRLSVNYKSLKEDMNVSQNTLKRIEEETKRLTQDADAAKKENENLKADALAYLKQQKSLQDATADAQRQLSSYQEFQRKLEAEKAALESELSKLKAENERLLSEMSASHLAKKEARNKGIILEERLQAKISQLEQTLNKERASYHYNLAVIHTNANQFDDAIKEYEEVLKVSPDDADSHYNLGILYEEYLKDKQKAIEHYQRYVGLRPDAEDIDDVKVWIERLGRP